MRRERRAALGYMTMIAAAVVMWAMVFQGALEVISG